MVRFKKSRPPRRTGLPINHPAEPELSEASVHLREWGLGDHVHHGLVHKRPEGDRLPFGLVHDGLGSARLKVDLDVSGHKGLPLLPWHEISGIDIAKEDHVALGVLERVPCKPRSCIRSKRVLTAFLADTTSIFFFWARKKTIHLVLKII